MRSAGGNTEKNSLKSYDAQFGNRLHLQQRLFLCVIVSDKQGRRCVSCMGPSNTVMDPFVRVGGWGRGGGVPSVQGPLKLNRPLNLSWFAPFYGAPCRQASAPVQKVHRLKWPQMSPNCVTLFCFQKWQNFICPASPPLWKKKKSPH